MIRLAAIASLALSACAVSAPAQTLEVAGDRLFIGAAVNGAPVEALLDSAAEISFADRTWAEEIGLASAGAETAKGTGGTAEAAFAEGVVVEALGVRLENLTVAVIDLADISARLVGRPLRFVMGRELFDRERLTIDIEGGEIAIADRALAPRGAPLSLAAERGIETFEVRVNGQSVSAAFDLGNGSEILIGNAFAEQLGLLNDKDALETRKGGGIGGAVERKIVRLATLEIAGKTFVDVEAAVDETESASNLNIGVRVLRHFHITTDFEDRTIWLAPR